MVKGRWAPHRRLAVGEMSSEVGADALELSLIDCRERRRAIGVDVQHRKNVARRR